MNEMNLVATIGSYPGLDFLISYFKSRGKKVSSPYLIARR